MLDPITVPMYAQPDCPAWRQTNHGLEERASAFYHAPADPVGSVTGADDGPLDVTVQVAQDHDGTLRPLVEITAEPQKPMHRKVSGTISSTGDGE